MILAELRQRTREHHLRVEAGLPLLRDDLTLDEYRALLLRFHGFYAPLEERLRRVPGWEAVGVSPVERSKAPLLAADLRALGVPEPRDVPACPGLPAVDGLPRALGCMYVLEGATLGGQLIRRQLARTLGIAPGSGCAFFASYGAEVGPMWKAFTAALEDFAAAHPVGGSIVDAACDTFCRLDAWLAGRPA